MSDRVHRPCLQAPAVCDSWHVLLREAMAGCDGNAGRRIRHHDGRGPRPGVLSGTPSALVDVDGGAVRVGGRIEEL